MEHKRDQCKAANRVMLCPTLTCEVLEHKLELKDLKTIISFKEDVLYPRVGDKCL